jgi:hypothetical protein
MPYGALSLLIWNTVNGMVYIGFVLSHFALPERHFRVNGTRRFVFNFHFSNFNIGINTTVLIFRSSGCPIEYEFEWWNVCL